MQGETSLLYSFLGLTFILAVFTTIHNASETPYTFSKDKPKRFERAQAPRYIVTVLGSAVPLAIYALFFTRNLRLILQFVLGCMIVIAISAVMVLYVKKDGQL